MEEKKFSKAAVVPENDKWAECISRCNPLYDRADDIRSPFARDYTRVLHSLAYRRLKHKTQVFFNAEGNDHICTRIEHVQHVESVSNTIAKELGKLLSRNCQKNFWVKTSGMNRMDSILSIM